MVHTPYLISRVLNGVWFCPRIQTPDHHPCISQRFEMFVPFTKDVGVTLPICPTDDDYFFAIIDPRASARNIGR